MNFLKAHQLGIIIIETHTKMAGAKRMGKYLAVKFKTKLFRVWEH